MSRSRLASPITPTLARQLAGYVPICLLASLAVIVVPALDAAQLQLPAELFQHELRVVPGHEISTRMQGLEPAGQGGWICGVGTAELKVYSGPKSMDSWETTLKNFKADKEPRTPAPGFGEGAYLIFMKRDKQVGDAGILVAKSGTHTLVLSLDADMGKPAESLRPQLETLMKLVLARVPKA